MTSDDSYITESYLRRKIECEHIAPAMASVLLDLASISGAGVWRTVCDHWFKDGKIQVTGAFKDRHTGKYDVFDFLEIEITSRFYKPGGVVKRSQPKGLSDVPQQTGQYTPIKNGGENPIVHTVDKKVTLTKSQSSELSRGVTLDLTAKGEVGYGGVTASLESHLGVTVNEQESESSSVTREQGFSDTVTVSPGESVAIVYQKTRKTYTQDFQIDAQADIGFNVTIKGIGKDTGAPHVGFLLDDGNADLWDSVHGTWHTTSFKSMHDFCGFIRGYDPRAPKMAGYMAKAGWTAKHKMGILENSPDWYLLQLTGSDTVVQDSDAAFSVEDVGGLSSLQVENKFGKASAGKPVGG